MISESTTDVLPKAMVVYSGLASDVATSTAGRIPSRDDASLTTMAVVIDA